MKKYLKIFKKIRKEFQRNRRQLIKIYAFFEVAESEFVIKIGLTFFLRTLRCTFTQILGITRERWLVIVRGHHHRASHQTLLEDKEFSGKFRKLPKMQSRVHVFSDILSNLFNLDETPVEEDVPDR